jgi:hypothetical protein
MGSAAAGSAAAALACFAARRRSIHAQIRMKPPSPVNAVIRSRGPGQRPEKVPASASNIYHGAGLSPCLRVMLHASRLLPQRRGPQPWEGAGDVTSIWPVGLRPTRSLLPTSWADNVSAPTDVTLIGVILITGILGQSRRS